MRETCPKNDYLMLDPSIESLAKKMLSDHEIDEAETISENLVVKSRREGAKRFLKDKIGDQPKRPIYYANFELNTLPHRTRNSVKYLGDFIDNLLKCIAVEKFNNDQFWKRSFGANLTKLKNKIPDDLYSDLGIYNRLAYAPSKHEFNVEEGRRHYFSSKEVVYILYMTVKLKERMVEISQEAHDYCNDIYPNPDVFIHYD